MKVKDLDERLCLLFSLQRLAFSFYVDGFAYENIKHMLQNIESSFFSLPK